MRGNIVSEDWEKVNTTFVVLIVYEDGVDSRHGTDLPIRGIPISWGFTTG